MLGDNVFASSSGAWLDITCLAVLSYSREKGIREEMGTVRESGFLEMGALLVLTELLVS